MLAPEKVVGPFTTQNLLFVIAIICAGITIAISFFLIMKHLHRYTEPNQQRQVIRIIFTPVVFSVFSALSILNYKVAMYLQPLIALYETFALAALFLLYVEYVAPDEHTRMSYFATLENRKPKGTMFKRKGYEVIPGGSQSWYRLIYCAVFLYVNIDIILTIVQEITQALGTYCEASFNPKFAHIWVLLITNVALGWAITAIVKFYFRMKSEPEFAEHKPGLKILSFKLIVGINFLQEIIFDILISTETVVGSHQVTGYDIKYGIPATLVAFEQILFAVFFHYSFRSREYHETMKEDLVSPRLGTFRAAAHAFNPTDLLKGMFGSIKLLAAGVRPFEPRDNSNRRDRRRARMGRGDNSTSHLEPFTYKQSQMGEVSPYPTGPAGVTVTAPQETGYSNAYGGAGYDQSAYPQQVGYAEPPRGRQSPPDYEMTGHESQRLHPGGYARTHSRDSSIDGGDARSARPMV